MRVLLILLLTSCSIQREEMFKNNPKHGDRYVYTVLQFGGKFAGESSSGTKAITSNEKSFSDLMLGLGFAVSTWGSVAIEKAKQITEQYVAGEITKRETQKQLSEISIAEISSRESVSKEAINSGSEVLPLNINTP